MEIDNNQKEEINAFNVSILSRNYEVHFIILYFCKQQDISAHAHKYKQTNYASAFHYKQKTKQTIS